MKNIHTIEIKYMGATSTRGSRVKLTSLRFMASVMVSYDYECDNIYTQAQKLLESHGFVCEYISEGRNGYYIHTSTFEDIKGLK